MRFKSSTNLTVKLIFLFVILILIGTTIPIILCEDKLGSIVISIINGSLIILLIWIYYKTEYIISNDILICRTAFIKKKIKISTINKITIHKGVVVPTLCKISTDIEGLIITYQKYEEIYISPENSTQLIDELIKINPNIKPPKNVE